MPRKTGGKIGVMLASTGIGAVTDWQYEETDVDVETTAAGDPVEDFESLRLTFRITGKARLDVASPYVIPTTLRGTKVACALKVESADANGLVTVTAKFNKLTVTANYKEAIEIAFELGPAGSAPVWDLTPLT